MNLSEERVNEIIDDLVERGILVARNEHDVTSTVAWRDAYAQAQGRTTTERVKAAATAIGFQFPTCCVEEYAFILAYLTVKERCRTIPGHDTGQCPTPTPSVTASEGALDADGMLRL